MSRKTFSNRLSWRVILIVSAIIVAILLVVAYTSSRLIEEEATRATQFMLHGTISDIERPLAELEVQTQSVAAHVKMQINDLDALDLISNNTVQQSSLINGLAIIIPGSTSRDEYIVYSYRDNDNNIKTLRRTGLSIMQNPWIQTIVSSRQPAWATPYYAVHRGEADAPRVTSYAIPLFDGNGNVSAIVCSDLTIAWLEEKVASIRPYENSLTTLSCSDDVVIGIDDSLMLANIKRAFAENKDFQELGEDMRQGNDSIRRRIGKGRNMSFVVYGPLSNGWMLSISCLYRDVMKRTNTMSIFLFILGFIGLSLVFYFCRRTIKKMTRPITELSNAAINMAKSNFYASLPEIKSQDEMKSLHDSFVYMQNSIVDYIHELKTTISANERMESELNVARNIQMGMLRSDFPDKLHAMLIPAKEVGGDLYDFTLKDNKLAFAIGDVSGKGVPASLMMAITSAAIRFVSGRNMALDKTLSRINDGVTESNSNNMFVTLFVGRIDLATGHMEFCNAGHNPIIIIPPDAEPFFLKAKPNLAVGLFTDFNYIAESIDLKPGTRIVAYTDGVTEAERADQSQFGEDRLLAWAADPKTRSLATPDKDVVDDLYATIHSFTLDNPQNDDITILSLSL